jgi:hypothetical protein
LRRKRSPVNLGERLVHYGLGGTLFWLGLVVIAFSAIPDASTAEWEGLREGIERLELPAEMQGVFAALGIVLVFTTGLLFDLAAGAFFGAWERDWFFREFATNRQWMRGFLIEHRAYWGHDRAILDRILDRRAADLSFWRDLLKKTPQQGEDQRLEKRAFPRIWELMTAIGTAEGSVSVDVAYWRVSRLVAMVFFGLGLWAALATSLAVDSTDSPLIPLLLLIPQLLLYIGSFAVLRRAYRLLIASLFASVFVVEESRHPSAPSRPPTK